MKAELVPGGIDMELDSAHDIGFLIGKTGIVVQVGRRMFGVLLDDQSIWFQASTSEGGDYWSMNGFVIGRAFGRYNRYWISGSGRCFGTNPRILF